MQKYFLIASIFIFFVGCSNPVATNFETTPVNQGDTTKNGKEGDVKGAANGNANGANGGGSGQANDTVPEVPKEFLSLSERFTQGGLGKDVKESFRPESAGVLDILLIVDNSGSMAEEQKNLATKLAPLLESVKNSNYQIAVTTTDPSDGCQHALIKKGDVDAEAKFAAAVQVGTSGSGNERGVLKAVMGLKNSSEGVDVRSGPCTGQPWLRDDSRVVVLPLTDEDNCSQNGSDCGTAPYANEKYLLDYLASIRVLGESARVYGIITPSDAVCPNSNNKKGIQYERLIAATGGTKGNICDADYTNTLKAISSDMAKLLKSQFVLSNTPDVGSVTVTYPAGSPADVMVPFTVNGQTITFKNPPTSEIVVSYTVGSQPVLTSFTLSKPAVPSSIAVYVNDQKQAADSYKFDASQNAVILSQSPDFASIRIDYQTSGK